MATPVSSKKNVRVLYDYNYEEKDGRHVTIKSGDECILVKKTDDDWWLVLRCGDKKGIYVPANYLQEIHMTTVVVGGGATVPPKVKPKPAKPPPIPKKPKPPLVEDDVLKEFDNMLDHALDGDSSEPQPDYDDDDETQKKHDKNTGEEAVEDDGDYINVPNIKSRTDATKAQTDANANKVRRETLENYENIPFKSERSSDAVDDREPEPDYENMSTELPQYANLEVIQETIRRRSKMSDSEGPEQPKEGAMADRVLIGGWEQHCDEAGRMFYFNPVTKQSQWEPPSGSSEDRLSVSSRHSLRRMTSMPPGWTEEQCDSGDVFFINDVTKERWQSSVDMSGRIYYFRENSSGESSWVLPENASTPTEPEGGDTLPTGGRPETDGASASSSPGTRLSTSNVTLCSHCQNSPDDSTEANSNRPLATRLKEYKGSLYKKKLLENNRKLKKNWAQCYVVTTGQMLYFYKDQKATNAKPNQPMGKPEVTIDLRDAEIIYTSEVVLARKNIIIVKTRSGTDEYMLQHDKSEEIHVWNQTLKGNIESLAKYSGRPTTLTLPHQRSVDTLPGSDHHSPSPNLPTRHCHARKQVPEIEVSYDRYSNPGTHQQYGKLYITDDADGTRRIKDWLTNWFKKRPPVETLRAKGIIQDAVFGSHLMSLYIKEDGKVPHFVIGCIAAIEDRGLTIDGIYRVSGNLAEIQKLKFCVNQDSDLDLVKSEFDLHVLTGALKMFFRELKEPLFPFNTFDKFMNAIKMPNKSMKTQLFRDLIKVLPPYSKDTMRTLFEHLLRVINCSKENRMQIQNIAIVFGPTLLWPEQPAENVAMTLVLQNQIVDFILHEYKKLF